MKTIVQKYFNSNTEAAPLAVFRIFFGLLMIISIVRFWAYGWIEKLYIEPQFFFSYYGFEWIKPLGEFTYLLFFIAGVSAFLVMIGYQYRLAIISFFLSFTYIELMDKTTYLNHYYFVSILSFLMIFLPANAYFSLDAKLKPSLAFQKVPAWTIDSIKLLLGIVYCYAGLAKLNPDWLLHAMPLKIWLKGVYDLPLIGLWLEQDWVAYVFSWGGAVYDLLIPFLLLNRRTRIWAFLAVLVFHILTRVLFPIGMFPYIMIASSLIFFEARFHHRILDELARVFRISKTAFDNGKVWIESARLTPIYRFAIIGFFVVQLAFPFRHVLYPGNLFWTEQGYRFSWRVMLMEKTGYAQFKVVDSLSGKRFYVDNRDFLHSIQEKQMATQPDFILEYAHYLANHFRSQGHQNLQIFVDAHVSLNGRGSRPYIDPSVDLARVNESFKHKTWILPFDE